MEGKHTKGPWKVVVESRENFVSGIAVIDAPDSVKSICRTYESMDAGGAEENMRNAQLISAAPELLEACEKALFEIEHWSCLASTSGDKGVKAYAMLKAAIAKARGEG